MNTDIAIVLMIVTIAQFIGLGIGSRKILVPFLKGYEQDIAALRIEMRNQETRIRILESKIKQYDDEIGVIVAWKTDMERGMLSAFGFDVPEDPDRE